MPKRKQQRDWIENEPLQELICGLCERPMGRRIERHHIIPKSKGGTETVPVHPICHRKIHKRFTNRELEVLGSLDAVKADDDIARFIKWLKGKPPDFYRRTR